MSNNLLPKPKLIFLSMTSCHERSLEIKWCINENFRWGIENKKHLNWFSVKWALPTDGKMSDIIMFIPRSWSNPILKWPHDIKSYNLPVIFILPLTCSRSRGRFRSWPVNFTHCYPARLMFNWHLDRWPRKIGNYFKVTKNRLKLQGSQKK